MSHFNKPALPPPHPLPTCSDLPCTVGQTNPCYIDWQMLSDVANVLQFNIFFLILVCVSKKGKKEDWPCTFHVYLSVYLPISWFIFHSHFYPTCLCPHLNPNHTSFFPSFTARLLACQSLPAYRLYLIFCLTACRLAYILGSPPFPCPHYLLVCLPLHLTVPLADCCCCYLFWNIWVVFEGITDQSPSAPFVSAVPNTHY